MSWKGVLWVSAVALPQQLPSSVIWPLGWTIGQEMRNRGEILGKQLKTEIRSKRFKDSLCKVIKLQF
jgi:hypothetical protein